MQQAQQDLLVLEAQSGNEKAFECLIAWYHPQLVKFACSLCGNQALAKDAVQDVWITITRKLRTLDDPRAFKSWLFRAVRWRVTDLAKSKFNQFVELDETETPTLPMETTAVNETAIEQRQMNKLIHRLPKKERAIVTLFYMADMTVAEIAQVQQIPQGTVKSQLNRARKQLAQLLDQ